MKENKEDTRASDAFDQSTPAVREALENKEQETWRERFDEKFGYELMIVDMKVLETSSTNVYHGQAKDRIKNFIATEISLALSQERSRLMEKITNVSSSFCHSEVCFCEYCELSKELIKAFKS